MVVGVAATVLICGGMVFYALMGERREFTEEEEQRNIERNPPSTSYQVEITRTRLIDWTNPEGRQLQMMMIDWKNTGSQPIGQVNATMEFYNADGKLIYEAKDYVIFLTENLSKAIKRGGEGHIVLPLDRSRATSTKIFLTKVAGVPPPL